MSYKVEFTKHGPGGNITYLEGGKPLSFEWGYNTKGIEIAVPSPYEWDSYCEEKDANWAKGRRQEILEIIAKEYCRQRMKKGIWRITDYWILVSFEKALLDKLVRWIFGDK